MRFVTTPARATGSGLIAVALVATIAAVLFPLWSYADRSGTPRAQPAAGSVPTEWGPLSATDRDFVVRVRLAGLWEVPAGQQAIGRAPTRAVSVAGEHLVEGHAYLDARVREVAARLGMELPDQPNAQQQGWLRELTAASGLDYQRKFANLLRAAHGKVFALVAQVRNSTRNTLVRELADDANTTVLDHIHVLEATGLVDFDAIAADSATASPSGPPPPVPGATPRPAAPVAPDETSPTGQDPGGPDPTGPAPIAPDTGGPGPTGPAPVDTPVTSPPPTSRTP
ncbi:DUF4142 domain-containing protein [Streptomyces sp. NPDC001941]|uniref:DUF4142 domain-containing protein n=1 Tax=Streptomyces sp. NPDC001941 TaxID=3154659 RepID=UPI00332F67E1